MKIKAAMSCLHLPIILLYIINFQMAETLSAELSQEQLNFIFNKTKNSKAEWNSLECPTKSLMDLNQEPVLDYFYKVIAKVEKVESKKEPSFSMTYNDDPVNKRNWLEDGYDKYNCILPGFSHEEFCKSMFQILASNRSDNELQNELFEMLGFDAFELISEMLENRKSIVECGLDFSRKFR